MSVQEVKVQLLAGAEVASEFSGIENNMSTGYTELAGLVGGLASTIESVQGGLEAVGKQLDDTGAAQAHNNETLTKAVGLVRATAEGTTRIDPAIRSLDGVLQTSNEALATSQSAIRERVGAVAGTLAGLVVELQAMAAESNGLSEKFASNATQAAGAAEEVSKYANNL